MSEKTCSVFFPLNPFEFQIHNFVRSISFAKYFFGGAETKNDKDDYCMVSTERVKDGMNVGHAQTARTNVTF